jgi:hypothetical protein
MKANHNNSPWGIIFSVVVVNISISKNESKSQLARTDVYTTIVVVNISISKNESKSQLGGKDSFGSKCCGKYQYFKE